jgi:hypothetical protein
MAHELLALRPDVILTRSTPATAAVKAETATTDLCNRETPSWSQRGGIYDLKLRRGTAHREQ